MFTKTQIIIAVILYVIHLALTYIPALAKFKSLETKVDTAVQGAVTTLTAQVVQETEQHIIPAVKNEVAKVTSALGLNKAAAVAVAMQAPEPAIAVGGQITPTTK